MESLVQQPWITYETASGLLPWTFKQVYWQLHIGIKILLKLILPQCCIYASVSWIIIGTGNGLSPIRRQAITSTNAVLLSIGLLGTSFSEILIGIMSFSWEKMHLKMSSGKWQPFCPGLNVLKQTTKIQLKLGHGRVITSHMKQWIWLVIRINIYE